MTKKIEGYKTLEAIAAGLGLNSKQAAARRLKLGSIVKIGGEYFATTDLQHDLIGLREKA